MRTKVAFIPVEILRLSFGEYLQETLFTLLVQYVNGNPFVPWAQLPPPEYSRQ